MRSLCFIVVLYSSTCWAQGSPFPKNYVGLFFVTGYYIADDYSRGYRFQNGVDYNTLGLHFSRRFTKNVYAQSNAFVAGKGEVYLDCGIKLNAFVHHKLQPFGGFTLGRPLGISETSPFYYSFGLEYHIAPLIVLHSSAFSDIGNHTGGFRFGGSYKF